nr:DUF6029 family protein [uncultured Dyadobacter sp.]
MRAFVVVCFMFWFKTMSLCHAQDTLPGQLSGGFETNSIYYLPDNALNGARPEDRLGSNNFLKLDYTVGKFSGGVVFEAYLPVLQGLPPELHGSKIAFKYAAFEDGGLRITAGDFYEQFGSGLALRAYEERLLGLNNAIEGVRIAYDFQDWLQLKAVYGKPRRYMKHADSQVRGADIAFNVGRLLGWKSHSFALEGSLVNKYESYTGTSARVKPNVNLLSLRAGWDLGNISLKGEYVYKAADPAIYNDNMLKDGSALLLEAGYTKAGTGIQLSLRRLEYMDFRSSRSTVGLSEVVNYLPALTRQYTYALANLNPYAAQGNGEAGGQLDFSQLFAGGTRLGGETGLTFNANISAYYNLKGTAAQGYDFPGIGKELYYRDINIDLIKPWNSRLKTTLIYSNQTFNSETIGKTGPNYRSHIAIADALYKLTPTRSCRVETSHLWSREDNGNWAALNLTYDVAPRWSFFAGDMYNYADTKIHYYNAGASFSRSRTRIALNYGRNRAGYQCAGGVCRLMPAYTGVNLSLTSSF